MQTLPFDTGNGPIRYRVLPGENDDSARRGDKTLVAVSECALTCQSQAVVERTVEALRASDEKLRNRAAAETFYDWQSTYVEVDPAHPDTMRVLFGVAWYDRTYFDRESEAFGNDMHQNMFDRLGITAEDVEVTHWAQVQLVA
jgi:hypothetical protein